MVNQTVQPQRGWYRQTGSHRSSFPPAGGRLRVRASGRGAGGRNRTTARDGGAQYLYVIPGDNSAGRQISRRPQTANSLCRAQRDMHRMSGNMRWSRDVGDAGAASWRCLPAGSRSAAAPTALRREWQLLQSVRHLDSAMNDRSLAIYIMSVKGSNCCVRLPRAAVCGHRRVVRERSKRRQDDRHADAARRPAIASVANATIGWVGDEERRRSPGPTPST